MIPEYIFPFRFCPSNPTLNLLVEGSIPSGLTTSDQRGFPSRTKNIPKRIIFILFDFRLPSGGNCGGIQVDGP